MKILITGANSFVGKNLILKLKKKHKLFLTDKTKSSSRNKIIIKDLNQLDYRDIKSKNIDKIIHLGAISTTNLFKMKPKDSFKTNVLSLVNLVDLAKKLNVKTIVFASSEWVYGQSNQKFQNEETNIMPENLESDYALSKKMGEDFLRYFSKKNGFNVVILRFGIIYGEKVTNLCAIESIVKNLVSSKNIKEVIIGSKRTGRRFIHVRDIVSAIQKITEIKIKKNIIFNVAGSKMITMEDIVKKSSILLNRKIKIIEKNSLKFNIRNPISKKFKKFAGWKDKVTLDRGLKLLINYHDKSYYSL